MRVNEILTKRPFVRMTPAGHLKGPRVRNILTTPYFETKNYWQVMSQADFWREYYPSGHRINDPQWYHDQIKYRERTDDRGNAVIGKDGTPEKDFFRQEVFRCSMPFQMIITAQQVLHLCGNDIQHEMTDSGDGADRERLFLAFNKGWIEKNIDVRFFDFVRSVKITADAAMVFYMDDKRVNAKVLSFMYGDTLFPHYNGITGKLDRLARRYCDYDDSGKCVTEFIEVWDNTYFYRYKKDRYGWNAVKNTLYDYFGIDGYVLCEPPVKHGFSRIPVTYKRTDGPCWMFAQDCIEKYEVAMSQLCQNNAAFAMPIVLMKGDEIDIQGDIYGNVKGFAMGKDDDVSYLEQDGHSENFKLQLEILLRMIFMGGFAVLPPEIKSGDLPGVAVKLIYAPSLERATIDARDFDECVDDIKEIFLEGYGTEQGMVTAFSSLSILSYIKPFVFSNDNDTITQLVQAAGAGILSKETASKKTGFNDNAEWEKIIREQKRQQAADRLYQLKNVSAAQSAKKSQASQ